jgi:hypothetical protein
MKRFLPIILALVVVGGVAVYVHASPDGRVYSYSVLVNLLRRHPGDWLGRTVLVRAQAEDTGYLPGPAMRLYDPASVVAPLALHPGPANPLLSLMRRAPLIGPLVPGLRRLDLEQPAVYRILLERGHGWDCQFMPTPCYSAVLLDAFPFPD